ncbi:uncharacterized protein LY89DRAFT_570040, partial [Mollisia scopiformis]
DPVFIAIDFEDPNSVAYGFDRNSDTQVGLSVLDSRNIHSASAKQSLGIKTFNFVTGSNQYFKTSARKDLWATSEHIPTTEMLQCIKKVIPRDRNIILVGHGFSHDVAALQSLGFDFYTSILGHFDTDVIARRLKFEDVSLGAVLKELGCPTLNLHNAGNDANFTLRALILLGIR